jgi:hypothetical protein
VAITAILCKDLESSSDASRVESAHELEFGPFQVTVVSSDLSYHLFVSLDTPEGPDVVSVQPALFLIIIGDD